MRKIISAILLSCSFVVVADSTPPEIKEILPNLQKWGQDSALVSAVVEQNKMGMTLADIQLRDTEWRATDGLDDRMKAIMASDAAKRLLELQKSQAYFFEIFLMDDQGANVAMTNKTSDYWQGDEAKFLNTYPGGPGSIYISDINYDESTQIFQSQVSFSVPKEISSLGVITFGVNVEKIIKYHDLN